MILRRLFYALCCTFALSTLSSQDIHYTLHNMAPLQLNPALTGSFYGSVRVGGIYRGQWHGSGGPKTANLFADAPIIRGLRKQDWIGVGFMLTNDKVNAAAVDFITNQTGFSAAYHLGLDKKQTSVLTLGLQYATTNFGFNLNMLGVDAEGNPRPIQEATIPQSLGGLGRTVGEMLGTSTTGGGGNSQDDGPRESFTSINAGLLFKTLLDEKKGNKVEIGFAMIHLNSDDYRSFVNDTIMSDMDPTRVGGDDSAESRERKSTIHAHVNLDYQLSEKLRFLPTLYYQNSAQNSSMSIQ
ncbi:MAG: type IX secretion system membrane protein PorP/SprF, partial [Bacteroidota bacterium]